MVLKKDLTLFDLVFYGLGIIIGAGIYVLIGQAAGIAGNSIWLSFVVAAFVAVFTGLSYAELSSMFPRDAAEYTYIKHALGNETFGFVIQWTTFFASVMGSSVVALGFGNYFQRFTGLNPILSAILLLVFFAFINYLGIKTSSKLNVVLTSLTIIGLLLVIMIGAPYIGSVDYFDFPNGITGTIGAATLVFFAYLGFDQIVSVSEEAKKARKNIPKAIIISIALSTLIYIFVAVSAVSVVPWQELGQSGTPLALVAAKGFGENADVVLSLFGIFATASTVLIFVIAGSRMIFGMAEEHTISSFLLRTDKKRGTPYAAIAAITALGIFFVWFGNISETAMLVDFSAFLIFATVNLCAFVMRFNHPEIKRNFTIPFSIGRVAVMPLIGFLISLFMLLQFNLQIAWVAVIIMVIGYLYFKYHESSAKVKS